MKKYKVKVEQIKEYEIEINDEIISTKDLEEFEDVMYSLDQVDDDKYGSLAYLVALNQANDWNFEGIGYPLIRGQKPYGVTEINKNINIVDMDEDYEDIEVEEMESEE